MDHQYNIGIVGLGIAGAASAMLLARRGHKVTVLERALQVGPVGAGLVLQPSGQEALKRIGLLEQVIGSAEQLDGLDAFLPNGRPLVRLRYSDIGAQFCGYGVHRGELFDVLHSAAISAGVDIRLGSEITETREQKGRVFVITSSGEQIGPFDFLIASDGSRSQIGHHQARRQGEIEYKYGAIWLVGRNADVRGRLHQVIRGTTQLLGLLPIGDERCTLFWGIRKDNMNALIERGFQSWREEVIRLYPLAEETLESVTSFEQAAFTTYRHSVPSLPFNGKLINLGDAGHAMSPHLGQGANLALADAVCFCDVLDKTDNFEAACEQFFAARRSAIRYYAALSRTLTPFFQSGNEVFGWGRNIALPIMCALPPMRREMTRAMAGVKCGLFRSDARIEVERSPQSPESETP